MTDDSKTRKPLAELNLLDDFLFGVVLEDKQNYRDILEIILEEEVPLLQHAQMEKVFRYLPVTRSVRMDVVAIDEDNKIYDAEMQVKNTGNLLKRERFYQAHLDVSLLKPGQVAFDRLNDTCLIMIMPFDLLGKGRYRYTCKIHCVEEPDMEVEDGTVRIFLNTRGTNPEGVSTELIDFLHYVEHSTSENCISTGSERIRRIHDSVQIIKAREDVGVRYMKEWERDHYIREEAREEGREEERLRLNELTKLLIQDERMEDILRGTEDLEYQIELLKEYGLY